MNKYLFFCPICKQKTTFKIYQLSRKQGARLQCLICGNIKKRYLNFKELEKKEIKQEKEIEDLVFFDISNDRVIIKSKKEVEEQWMKKKFTRM